MLVNTPKLLNWSGTEKKAEKQIIPDETVEFAPIFEEKLLEENASREA